MIRRLLARFLPPAISKDPTRYAAEVHKLRGEHISPAALQISERLRERGYQAYIVGGAIRDLLFGLKPKDFDIATNAKPEEIKPLFRRAFIIGRRFRLVHVLIAGETVEVSTFRGRHTSADTADEHGRLLTDNVFGTHAEDAARRDFTVNALYYDPGSGEILDFLGGMRDIEARRLRLIGPPIERYREDPVRMLRAIRLAAKLNIRLDERTEAPISKLAPLIRNVPAPRLFDEMLKLLLSGNAREALRNLRAHGLHHGLLPLLDVILEQPLGSRFIELALENTDRRIREGKTVSPGFLFATLLWHQVLLQWNTRREAGERPMPALHGAMESVLEQQTTEIAIPRRFTATTKEIWVLQPRFEQRSGERAFRLLEQPRFRAAYDFLRLRCESGEAPMDVGLWWERFQQAHPEEKKAMLLPVEQSQGRRRRPRRKRNAARSVATP